VLHWLVWPQEQGRRRAVSQSAPKHNPKTFTSTASPLRFATTPGQTVPWSH